MAFGGMLGCSLGSYLEVQGTFNPNCAGFLERFGRLRFGFFWCGVVGFRVYSSEGFGGFLGLYFSTALWKSL